MSENVHRYLDGDASRSDVPLPEQEALREIGDAITAARSWVQEQEVPDLANRVMAVLSKAGAPTGVNRDGERAEPVAAGLSGATGSDPSAGARAGSHRGPLATVIDGIRWIWTPRPLSVRPAVAGAFVVLIVAAVMRPTEVPPASPPMATSDPAIAAATRPIYIQFRLDTSEASDVALAGTFTQWQPAYSLHESAPGVWTVTVPLEPGVHDYLFIVDGERWVPDPAATPVDDGFGGTNSRLLLSAPRNEA